jgi:nucleotide-sensitive chloride channel 1A
MCHALSRETGSLSQKPCIYAQMGKSYCWSSIVICVDNDDEETCEARFIPEDSDKVEAIYTAFSECAAMNPDPIEEDEGNFFYNADEMDPCNRISVISR